MATASGVARHIAGVVVEQGEQHRPLAVDDRAVQAVADPHLVGFGADLRSSAGRGGVGPDTVTDGKW